MSADHDRIALAIERHATLTLDGCWTQCSCDGVWRGQQQWAGHVADEVAKAVAGHDQDAKPLSLHGRITRIIRDNFSPRLWADADDIADVLIAELGLTVESGVIVGCLHE